MGKITNTAREENLVPEPFREVGLLPGYLVVPGSIEAQEARGAAQLAAQAEQLPADGSMNPVWEKMGVIFGDPVDGDPLFRKVTLPAGWKIERTDHSMWTKLVDDKGRERGQIFYKAAFYDRRADIRTATRFATGPDYGDNFNGRRATVTDCGKVIFATEALDKRSLDFPREDRAGYEAQRAKEDANVAAALAWLVEHYPDWEDPTAYWD